MVEFFTDHYAVCFNENLFMLFSSILIFFHSFYNHRTWHDKVERNANMACKKNKKHKTELKIMKHFLNKRPPWVIDCWAWNS